ncbi:MAG: phasin family protein [Pseudomonadota bacterium]
MTTATKTTTTAAPAAKPAAKTAAKPAPKAAAPKIDAKDENEGAFAFSNAASDQYDALLKSFNENAEEMQGRTQELMDASRESFEAMQTRMQETSAELMDAARQEMSEAVDFANELTRAKSMGEALEIQRDYWTRLFETRVERVRAMTEASMDVMRETSEPVQRSMQTAFSANPFTSFLPTAEK